MLLAQALDRDLARVARARERMIQESKPVVPFRTPKVAHIVQQRSSSFTVRESPIESHVLDWQWLRPPSP